MHQFHYICFFFIVFKSRNVESIKNHTSSTTSSIPGPSSKSLLTEHKRVDCIDCESYNTTNRCGSIQCRPGDLSVSCYGCDIELRARSLDNKCWKCMDYKDCGVGLYHRVKCDEAQPPGSCIGRGCSSLFKIQTCWRCPVEAEFLCFMRSCEAEDEPNTCYGFCTYGIPGNSGLPLKNDSSVDPSLLEGNSTSTNYTDTTSDASAHSTTVSSTKLSNTAPQNGSSSVLFSNISLPIDMSMPLNTSLKKVQQALSGHLPPMNPISLAIKGETSDNILNKVLESYMKNHNVNSPHNTEESNLVNPNVYNTSEIIQNTLQPSVSFATPPIQIPAPPQSQTNENVVQLNDTNVIRLKPMQFMTGVTEKNSSVRGIRIVNNGLPEGYIGQLHIVPANDSTRRDNESLLNGNCMKCSRMSKDQRVCYTTSCQNEGTDLPSGSSCSDCTFLYQETNTYVLTCKYVKCSNATSLPSYTIENISNFTKSHNSTITSLTKCFQCTNQNEGCDEISCEREVRTCFDGNHRKVHCGLDCLACQNGIDEGCLFIPCRIGDMPGTCYGNC